MPSSVRSHSSRAISGYASAFGASLRTWDANAASRDASGPCANARDTPTYNHMVARSLSSDELDRLFRALGDTTRRDIVARLQAGETASVSSLASRYDMSFAAVQKHVAVLEEAGLVTKEAQGRERIVRSNPERLAQARALLLQLEQLWIARFSQLDQILADPKPSRD